MGGGEVEAYSRPDEEIPLSKMIMNTGIPAETRIMFHPIPSHAVSHLCV